MKRLLIIGLLALWGAAASAGVIKTIQAGSTDQTITLKIVDATDGTPETAVAFNTAGIDLEYWRHGANAAVDITEATQTVNGAHADGGFVHIGHGIYRLDLPDAAVASGATAVEVYGTVTGMIVIGGTVDLSPPVNVVAYGGTAGTFAGGRPEVNTSHISGSAVSTSSAQIGVNVVNAGGTAWGSGAITAASIATDAIGAAEVAADAGTEIGTAVWATTTRQLTSAQTFNITGNLSGSVGSVTGAVGSVTGSVGSIATGGITEASFATTAGSFDALGIIDQGTAQAATATTLQLRAAASFADDEIIGATCLITGGTTGVGQARTITDYVSSTDTATVATWTTTPTGTITYQCFGTASSSGGSGASAADVWSYATRSLTILDEDSTTLDLNATAVGSVAGAVGSVTGAVGSVTGNVGGNVTGSVGSVATGGITTGSFAAGAINAAAIATDAIGAAEIAADAGTEIGTATWATTTRTLTSSLDPNAAAIADAVWDEARTGHTTAGTFGFYLDSAISGVSTGGISAGEIADAVWDEALSGHATAGSAGAGLTAASGTLSAAAVRSAIGLATANLDTQLSGIQSDTDALQSTIGVAGAGLTAVDDAVLSAIAALNNLSATQVRDLIIEDQGGGVSLGCALSVLLAYASGDLVTSGANSTYEDPSGTETRATGTVASAGNRTATITCPTY